MGILKDHTFKFRALARILEPGEFKHEVNGVSNKAMMVVNKV